MVYGGLSLQFSSPAAEMVGLNQQPITILPSQFQSSPQMSFEDPEVEPSQLIDSDESIYDDLLAVTDPEGWEKRALGNLDDATNGHR